jgi:hypothetical protein
MASAPRYARGGTLVKEMTIGEAMGDDDYLFESITNVLLARDGSVWILDVPQMTGAPTLRRYDASGKFVGAVGRQGKGPGEYTGPTGLAQLPDGRVILRDIRGSRINVYSESGAPESTWVQRTNYTWPVRGGDGVRVDRSGIVWMPFDFPRAPNAPPGDRTAAFVRLRADGTIIDSVQTPADAGGPRQTVTITKKSSTGFTRITLGAPFGWRGIWAWNPGGYFATARTDRYAIDMLAPKSHVPGAIWKQGDPVVSIRRNMPAVELSAAEWKDQDKYLHNQIDSYDGSVSGSVPEIPRTKPPLKGFSFGEDGRLWVSVAMPSERFEPPPREVPPGTKPRPVLKWREPNAYDVFEADGTYLGRVPLPLGVYPTVMRGDEVWCVARDEDGVNTLVKYRITWR